MTDLGFGMADRRSVIVALFVFMLSHYLLNYPMPIDTTNVLTTFVSLVLLTGFLYLARSILRFVLIILFTLCALPIELIYHFVSERRAIHGLRGIFIHFGKTIFLVFLKRLVVPLFIVRDWDFSYNRYTDNYFTFGVLGILDRLILVGVAFAATMPSSQNLVQTSGLVGLVVISVIFVITGKFSFVLYDAMHKAEADEREKHREQVAAARNPNVSWPSKIYTEPASRYEGP